MGTRHLRPTRRDFLQASGALIVSISLPVGLTSEALAASRGDMGPSSPPTPAQLDSWLAVKADGSVVAFTGKAELGMGVETALAQIVAEELDVAFDKVTMVMSDTALTPDQGGTGGSTTISSGSNPLRNAAAEARLRLVDMAATRLGVPAARLTVKDGIVSVLGDASKRITYGQLIGRNNFHFDVPLTTKGSGSALNAIGSAKPKSPSQYGVVGQPIRRVDIPAKATGQFSWIVDVRVPGMLHGRVLRPPAFGATLADVDVPKGIPGLVKVLRRGNFLGVVADTEWHAIQAARSIKPSWSSPAPQFPTMDNLYSYMRGLQPQSGGVTKTVGDFDGAIAGAARVITASYNWPFQSHAMMGPACAVADVKQGSATIWSSTQKGHALRTAIANLLGLAQTDVRVIWVEGSGSYGRSSADDAASDAALMSQMMGKPIRVQWMRPDEITWDPKGPPVVVDMRAGIDGGGDVIAYEFVARDFSGSGIPASSTVGGDMLAGQLIGKVPVGSNEAASVSDSYGFPNKRYASYVLPWPQSQSPLRTAHMRAPEQLSTTFGSESFIDEIAATLGVDPVAFRLRSVTDPRDTAVIQAAAQMAGWQTRPSPQTPTPGTGKVSGRGFAASIRSGTHIALVAEVTVDRQTGQVHPTHYWAVQDAGLIINPLGMEGVVQANLVQATSRSLFEEVQFNPSSVTSMDWTTYPIAMIGDVPDAVDVKLINRPELPPSGAGEPMSVIVAAALANAVFDATGVRIRTVPLTPQRVLAAMR